MFATCQEICGTPWLIIASTIALLNFLVAVRLVFVSQSVIQIVAFKPVTFLPFVLGVIAATTGLIQSVEVSISDQSSQSNPTLLLAWGVLPLFVGGTLSVPAFTLAAFGRLWLATRGVKKPTTSEPTHRELKEKQLAADEASYQSYADFVNSAGHRKGR